MMMSQLVLVPWRHFVCVILAGVAASVWYASCNFGSFTPCCKAALISQNEANILKSTHTSNCFSKCGGTTKPSRLSELCSHHLADQDNTIFLISARARSANLFKTISYSSCYQDATSLSTRRGVATSTTTAVLPTSFSMSLTSVPCSPTKLFRGHRTIMATAQSSLTGLRRPRTPRLRHTKYGYIILKRGALERDRDIKPARSAPLCFNFFAVTVWRRLHVPSGFSTNIVQQTHSTLRSILQASVGEQRLPQQQRANVYHNCMQNRCGNRPCCGWLEASAKYVGRKLRSCFLPEQQMSPHYFHYIRWRAAHRLLSASMSVFATQALLLALNLKSRSVGDAAALQWILKDVFGKLGRLSWASKFGGSLDVNAKQWRVRGAMVHCVANALEVLTYLAPQWFLVLGAMANTMKQVSLLNYAATRNAIYQSFAIGDGGNIGDITAKSEAQVSVVDLVGMSLAVKLTTRCLKAGKWSILAAFSALSVCNIYTMFREIRSVVMDRLNYDRARLVISDTVARTVFNIHQDQKSWINLDLSSTVHQNQPDTCGRKSCIVPAIQQGPPSTVNGTGEELGDVKCGSEHRESTLSVMSPAMAARVENLIMPCRWSSRLFTTTENLLAHDINYRGLVKDVSASRRAAVLLDTLQVANAVSSSSVSCRRYADRLKEDPPQSSTADFLYVPQLYTPSSLDGGVLQAGSTAATHWRRRKPRLLLRRGARDLQVLRCLLFLGYMERLQDLVEDSVTIGKSNRSTKLQIVRKIFRQGKTEDEGDVFSIDLRRTKHFVASTRLTDSSESQIEPTDVRGEKKGYCFDERELQLIMAARKCCTNTFDEFAYSIRQMGWSNDKLVFGFISEREQW
eukprot:GHVQ01032862.1.p1 GENE.GHVQ01032862.1~~GHVQ01032862.1.p1  ORF type:complete len:854 (-),score=80.45 GHVQ01032862.1:95-2656(-)